MKKIIVILLACLPFLLHAQKDNGQIEIDSLLKEMPKQKEDTNKVIFLNTLGRCYYDINPDEGLKYVNQALVLAHLLNFKNGIAISYSIMVGICTMKGNLSDALKDDSIALKLFRELNDKYGIASSYVTMSTIYSQQDNYPDALKSALTALKIYEELKYTYGIASSYSNIGTMYANQNNDSEALKNYLSSLKLLDQMDNKPASGSLLINIATIYSDFGNDKEAIKNTYEALKKGEEVGDKYLIASSYTCLGDIYYTVKNYPLALKNYLIAIVMIEELGLKMNIGIISGNIGGIYNVQRKYKEAEKYASKELTIGKELGSLALMKEANQTLSEVYAATGRYQKSLEAYKGYTVAKDSMFNEENTRKTVKIQMQYDFDKKESLGKAEQGKKDAIVKLKLERKNVLIYGALSALVALLAIGALIIRQNKLKANQQRMELEQKQLRAQMNPHFIFNCLNSIQHFVVDNDVKNANKYLSGFASLMRQTLENSKEGTITLRKEMAYLENYLSLELMRFEDKFSYQIICEENINKDTVEIPSMIIQPFIENAIRHGLCFLKDRIGKLTIRFYLNGSHLFCEIDDNGIGREQSQKLKIDSDIVYESHGMELTRQRLALVSKSSGSDYEIEVKDKKNTHNEPEGTTVTIKFPANT